MLELPGIYLDGDWRPSTGDDRVTVVNPATEEPYGSIPIGSAEDVDRAVTSSARALSDDSWAGMPLGERRRIVERIGQLLAAHRHELAERQTRSMGTIYRNALGLGSSVELIDMYLESVSAIDFEYLRVDRFGHTLIQRRPVGVVAGIVPWNAPVRSEVKKTIPALLAGCTVVLKPAPEAPFGAARFVELCTEAGVPDGVVNLVPGDRTTGEALVQHPAVRKIAFTGSTATGARISSLAAPAFKRLQLELGGKSAALILDDVDLSTALSRLTASSWPNAGQACVALTRILAPATRYDEVVAGFVEAAKREVLGDPMAEATTMGPLVAERQRTRVLGYIESGLADGAHLEIGGDRPAGLRRGWYVEPTVFSHVSQKMSIAREEIFGPVVVVIPYQTLDEAIAIANDSDYGLHGAVFGADDEHALAVAKRLDTGSVGINRFYLPSSAPFGGVKCSGVGREHGPEGFDSFLEYVSYNIPAELAERLGHLPHR